MNCKVRPTSYFLKEVKRLSKRYKSLKDDLDGLVASLHENPLQGVNLGGGLHKLRMAVTSKGKGKRGGARVITYVLLVAKEGADVLLLAIYDKLERENISDAELLALKKEAGL